CGGTLVLVDAVAELLEAATSEARSVAGAGVEVRPVLADAEAEDLAELVPPADLVWVSHVLHHLPDELHAAGRLAGLLRKGGRLALGEGGLPTRCLPWDLGLGEPGLEHRLEVARNEWFTAMRENIPGTVRLPVGWNLVLAEIGLADLETFSYLVHHPAPATQDVRDMAAERLSWFAEIGAERLSAEDLAVLRRLLDAADTAFVAARDDVYLLSTRTVFTGRAARDRGAGVRTAEGCWRCGRVRDTRGAPADAIAWVSEKDGDVLRLLCPQCARGHVRDIEGRLPAQYW
ncbi:MAG: class I SAM-dependent methyltransferase, partial [Sciscionella sp.]